MISTAFVVQLNMYPEQEQPQQHNHVEEVQPLPRQKHKQNGINQDGANGSPHIKVKRYSRSKVKFLMNHFKPLMNHLTPLMADIQWLINIPSSLPRRKRSPRKIRRKLSDTHAMAKKHTIKPTKTKEKSKKDKKKTIRDT